MMEPDEQARAMIREYISIDDEVQRRAWLATYLGHPPSLYEWEFVEAQRAGLRALQTGMTSGDIAALTGLTRATIRRMSERGEMPALAYRGEVIKWWWWDRAAIETWWEQRQQANGERA